MKRQAELHGTEDLLVVFGMNEPRNLRVMATTVREGDPSWSGALAGVALGLPSYHILELKNEIPEEVWTREMALSMVSSVVMSGRKPS